MNMFDFRAFQEKMHKLGCVVRMVVDSILPHAESGQNDHRKDAPPFMPSHAKKSLTSFWAFQGASRNIVPDSWIFKNYFIFCKVGWGIRWPFAKNW